MKLINDANTNAFISDDLNWYFPSGKKFLTNLDYPNRIKLNAIIDLYEGGSSTGYTEYPLLKD